MKLTQYKKEAYKKLDNLINNYIVNKKGLYEIISLTKKLINQGNISKYKVNQVNKLCNIDIKFKG